jgi:hypothetical protein
MLMYYIENPLMILSINIWSVWGNGYKNSCIFWGIGKGHTKKGELEKGWASG